MTIITLSAHNLPKMDKVGWCNPFVNVYVNDELVSTTKKFKSTAQCTWDPINLEDVENDAIIKFEVIDNDATSGDDLIGTVEKEYGEFIEDETNDEASYELQIGGKLSLQIDKYNMNLRVEMTDIVDLDFWGASDPYFIAKIRYYGADTDEELVEIYTSEVLNDKEACVFPPFPVACRSLKDNLVLDIFDKDPIGEDVIGRAEFSFNDIVEEGYDTVWNLIGDTFF